MARARCPPLRRGGLLGSVPLGHLVRAAADRAPEAPAVLDAATGLSLTHRELAERADAAAVRLLRRGLSPGDRIVVQLGDGPAFVILTLACLRAGIVPVMALPAHRRRELTHLCLLSEASAIAVPDVLRGFDHRAPAHELGAPVREATGGPWHVLVAGAPPGGNRKRPGRTRWTCPHRAHPATTRPPTAPASTPTLRTPVTSPSCCSPAARPACPS